MNTVGEHLLGLLTTTPQLTGHITRVGVTQTRPSSDYEWPLGDPGNLKLYRRPRTEMTLTDPSTPTSLPVGTENILGRRSLMHSRSDTQVPGGPSDPWDVPTPRIRSRGSYWVRNILLLVHSVFKLVPLPIPFPSVSDKGGLQWHLLRITHQFSKSVPIPLVSAVRSPPSTSSETVPVLSLILSTSLTFGSPEPFGNYDPNLSGKLVPKFF